MSRAHATALVAIAGLAAAVPSRAFADGACDATRGAMPVGPVQASLLDGELGLARRLCPRTEIAAGVSGLVVADFADFYGNVRASGVLFGSWAPDAKTEVFGTIEALRYQTVISSVDAAHFGPGHLSIGATRIALDRGAWALGASSRLVLPTAVALYENAWPFGIDLSALVEWSALEVLRVHGRVGGLAQVALSNGPADPAGALLAGGGAAWRPLWWLALVLDVDASFGRTDVLDHLAIAPALRFAIGARLGLEVGATVPIGGRERALAAALLRASVRL